MLKNVYTHRDGNALIDIGDEVERLFGFGITVVSLGTLCTLSIDDSFPHWQKAFEYARELVAAAKEGREAYKNTIRS